MKTNLLHVETVYRKNGPDNTYNILGGLAQMIKQDLKMIIKKRFFHATKSYGPLLQMFL
jgi:hypothetical protein